MRRGPPVPASLLVTPAADLSVGADGEGATVTAMQREIRDDRGDASPRVRTAPTVGDWRAIACWSVLYIAACAFGRASRAPGTEISLVWPAAGVSVLWLLHRAYRPWRWLDLVALALSTAAVVTLTGGSALPTLIGAGAATLQAVVVVEVLRRLVPDLVAARGRQQLHHITDVWYYLLATVTAAVISSPLIELALTVQGAGSQGQASILWIARNTVSVLGLGTLGLAIGEWVQTRRRQGRSLLEGWAGGRSFDLIVLVLLAPLIYLVWFLALDTIALLFPLIALTVWAGSRLPVRSVVLHTLLCGTVAVQLTVAGSGPLVTLPDSTTQVVVAQLYVGLITIIGLALSVAGEERRELVTELASARDRAQEQAALLGTVVDTMSEGVRVVDRDGRLVLRNPTATLLLTGHADLGADDQSDLAGLTDVDGRPVPAAELPFQRALSGQRVRDMDLLVRVPGQGQPRIVTFSSSLIPESSGGGVVTVLRDVTAERTELRRAAQVQASLLPSRGPQVPGLDVAARFVPAGSVGGDFYDWETPPGGGLVLTLADVMGKGPAAAILAATTRSVLQAQPRMDDVAGTLTATEHALDADLANAGAFVTLFRAYVDAEVGTVSYTDAGHGLTLIVHADGTARRLEALGLPLGVAPGALRTSARADLAPGDLLITFSDGVLDALGGSIADLDQVRSAVLGTRTAEDAADAVMALVGDAGTAEDDLTVVTLLRAS